MELSARKCCSISVLLPRRKFRFHFVTWISAFILVSTFPLHFRFFTGKVTTPFSSLPKILTSAGTIGICSNRCLYTYDTLLFVCIPITITLIYLKLLRSCCRFVITYEHRTLWQSGGIRATLTEPSKRANSSPPEVQSLHIWRERQAAGCGDGTKNHQCPW